MAAGGNDQAVGTPSVTAHAYGVDGGGDGDGDGKKMRM